MHEKELKVVCMRIIYDYLLKKKSAEISYDCLMMLDKEIDYISFNSPKQANILRQQFYETVETIERMPTMGAIYKGDMRRIKLGKFRYYIYYRETKAAIEILGIWHTSKGTEF